MKFDDRILKQMAMFGQSPSIFGLCLPKLIESHPEIMVLVADQANPAGLDSFRTRFPAHFVNVGIAEQNMIGMAAGIAETGKRSVCVAQACFITMRAYEPVRQFCGYMGIPLILVGISSGFGLTLMGNTHYSLEDIALMRTVPGMSVACPANPQEAVEAFEEALVHDGPVYIRLNGFKETQLPINLEHSDVLRHGDDVNIIATGSMVLNSLKAADVLGEHGFKVRVYNAKTVVPLRNEALESIAPLTVTVEEHRLIGGLGDAVATKISENNSGTRLLKLGVEVAFPHPGSYAYLLEQSGLMPEQIARRIMNELKITNHGNKGQSN